MKRSDKVIKAFIIFMMFTSLGTVINATENWYIAAPICIYWLFAVKHMLESWFPKNCMWLKENNDH